MSTRASLRNIVSQEGIIGTYSNDTVVRVPSASTAENDRRLMRETGRKLAESYLAHPPLLKKSGLEEAAAAL
jgi:hypothetical protein